MKHNVRILFATLVMTAATACGTDPGPPPESELDYHILAIYSQFAVDFSGDAHYDADTIAAALRAHPIHYYERPAGWTFRLGPGQAQRDGATLADGINWEQPNGSWHMECVHAAFAHEVAHYLMETIGHRTDPQHLDAVWWGPNGVVDSVNIIADER